jgi:TonB family protein
VRIVLVPLCLLLGVPAYAAAPIGKPLDDSALSGETASEMKTNGFLVNVPPKLDPQGSSCPGAPAEAGTLRLRMQVLKDGKIGPIMVAETSGSSTLDKSAADFVKATWHFTPASVAGTPVPAWLTARLAFDGQPASCPKPAANPDASGPIQ